MRHSIAEGSELITTSRGSVSSTDAKSPHVVEINLEPSVTALLTASFAAL